MAQGDGVDGGGPDLLPRIPAAQPLSGSPGGTGGWAASVPLWVRCLPHSCRWLMVHACLQLLLCLGAGALLYAAANEESPDSGCEAGSGSGCSGAADQSPALLRLFASYLTVGGCWAFASLLAAMWREATMPQLAAGVNALLLALVAVCANAAAAWRSKDGIWISGSVLSYLMVANMLAAALPCYRMQHDFGWRALKRHGSSKPATDVANAELRMWALMQIDVLGNFVVALGANAIPPPSCAQFGPASSHGHEVGSPWLDALADVVVAHFVACASAVPRAHSCR